MDEPEGERGKREEQIEKEKRDGEIWVYVGNKRVIDKERNKEI